MARADAKRPVSRGHQHDDPAGFAGFFPCAGSVPRYKRCSFRNAPDVSPLRCRWSCPLAQTDSPHSLQTRRSARALSTNVTCAFPQIEPVPVAPLGCDADCRARQRGASRVHLKIKTGSIYMFICLFLSWHGFCCGEPAMDLHDD